MKKKLLLVALMSIGMLFTSCTKTGSDGGDRPGPPDTDDNNNPNFNFWFTSFGAKVGVKNTQPIWITEDNASLIPDFTGFELKIKHPEIATIDENGYITGIKAGNTVLNAKNSSGNVDININIYNFSIPLWNTNATVDEIKTHEASIGRKFISGDPSANNPKIIELFFLGENSSVIQSIYYIEEGKPNRNSITVLAGAGYAYTYDNMFSLGTASNDQFLALFSPTSDLKDTEYVVGLTIGSSVIEEVAMNVGTINFIAKNIYDETMKPKASALNIDRNIPIK